MPSQNPDNGTQYIVAIFFIAVFVFLLMLLGVAIMALPQLRGRGKSTQTSSSGLPALSSGEAASPEAASVAGEVALETETTPLTALDKSPDIPLEEAPSAAQTAPETELVRPASLEERVDTPSERGQEPESTNSASVNHRADATPEQSKEPLDLESWSIRQILGVALTGASIMAPLLVAIIFPSVFGASAFPGLLFIPFWTALSGAIGLRAAKLSWQQTFLAALLAGVTLPMLGSFLGRWDLGGPYAVPVLFAGLIWVSAGMFLLPLFDPVVRRAGLAPSTWKVVVTALALSAPLLVAYYLERTPTIPVLVSGILLAGGFILALFRPYAAAASWLGGLGILFAWFMLVGGLAVEAIMSRLPG